MGSDLKVEDALGWLITILIETSAAIQHRMRISEKTD